jgi:hypothetical protein
MSENTRTPGDYGTGALQELRGCLLRADQIYPSSSVIGRSIAIVDELLRPHPADNAASPNEREIAAFQDKLRIRGQLIESADISLHERVKEFIRKHGLNGGKTGREDYGKMIPLSDIEAIRVALDEYDRVRRDTKALPSHLRGTDFDQSQEAPNAKAAEQRETIGSAVGEGWPIRPSKAWPTAEHGTANRTSDDLSAPSTNELLAVFSTVSKIIMGLEDHPTHDPLKRLKRAQDIIYPLVRKTAAFEQGGEQP